MTHSIMYTKIYDTLFYFLLLSHVKLYVEKCK